MYQAIGKQNQLIVGDGKVAIVTGWTVASVVAKKLNKDQYAVIGQLYSPTRGISFLVRNLLANPHVRTLMLLSATAQDETAQARGCLCLFHFIKNGFSKGFNLDGKECWVINSEVTGYIDIEIPEKVLNKLRKSIQVALYSSLPEMLAEVDIMGKNPVNDEPWYTGERLIFPEVKSIPKVLPGPRYGHRIEGKTIAETWVKIIHRIKTTGTIRPTGYDGKWQELIDLVAVVTDEPEDFYVPEPNYLPCDHGAIDSYIPYMLNDAETREGVKYTYGQRLRSWFGYDQIEQVINKLIGEIDAASAVMSLWDVKDHEKGGSPCLNHIWVRIVDNELTLTATFRSNDMFSAWPSNAFGLRALQVHITKEIMARSDFKLTVGPLITISQSAHIYDDCWENADGLINQQYRAISLNQIKEFADPCGSFVISLGDNEIIVDHITPGPGNPLNTFTGKNSISLVREIATVIPWIQPSHAIYLGTELNKAEMCLRHGWAYLQDQPIKL